MLRKRGDPSHEVPSRVEDVGEQVLDALFDAHRELGPGLLESVYVAAVERLLRQRGLRVQREVPISATFQGEDLGLGFRADLVVEECVLVEVKAVQGIRDVHEAQLLTYLKFARIPLGYLVNFGEKYLRAGLRRRVCWEALPRASEGEQPPSSPAPSGASGSSGASGFSADPVQ